MSSVSVASCAGPMWRVAPALPPPFPNPLPPKTARCREWTAARTKAPTPNRHGRHHRLARTCRRFEKNDRWHRHLPAGLERQVSRPCAGYACARHLKLEGDDGKGGLGGAEYALAANDKIFGQQRPSKRRPQRDVRIASRPRPKLPVCNGLSRHTKAEACPSCSPVAGNPRTSWVPCRDPQRRSTIPPTHQSPGSDGVMRGDNGSAARDGTTASRCPAIPYTCCIAAATWVQADFRA